MWTRAFYEGLRPLLIENWAQGLHRLSFASRWARLSPAEARFLTHGERILHTVPNGDEPPALADLLATIGSLMTPFPLGAFLRLGTGSAKDTAIHVLSRGRYRSPLAFVKAVQGSARLQRHLRHLDRLGEAPSVVARRWTRLPRWGELRLFVLDGRLAGLSQMDLSTAYPKLAQKAPEALGLVTADILPPLLSALPTRRFSADLSLHIVDGRLRCRLVELNPGNPMTDAILFDWSKPADFDGSLRCLARTGEGLIATKFWAT